MCYCKWQKISSMSDRVLGNVPEVFPGCLALLVHTATFIFASPIVFPSSSGILATAALLRIHFWLKKKKKQSYKYINLPKAVSRRANWIYLFIYLLEGGGLIARQKDVYSRTPEIMTIDVPKRETPLKRWRVFKTLFTAILHLPILLTFL